MDQNTINNQPVNPIGGEAKFDWTPVVVIAILAVLGLGVWGAEQYLSTPTTAENTTPTEEVAVNTITAPTSSATASVNTTVENNNGTVTATTVSNPTPSVGEVGSGEIVFMASANTDSIIREIQLHNPTKDSWFVVYDGYKSVSQTPVEVYRANLASLLYDKVQVRTVDMTKTLDRMVQVMKGESVTVMLDL